MRILPEKDELPRALYSAAQVREFDRLAIERYQIPGIALMERAGAAAFALLRERWPSVRRIAVVVGTGNNGGDGFVVARLAREAGIEVRVLQIGDRERLRGDALSNAQRWASISGVWDDFDSFPRDTELVVDALFGTGLERRVEGQAAAAIDAANALRVPLLAIDLPSGLHADTGAVLGTAIRASATISFIGLKIGLLTGQGPDRAGAVVFDSLRVPAVLYASSPPAARRIDWTKLAALLPPRARAAHKGDFGHLLVIGGNHGMGGAARLAAEAALRAGAGRVSLATRAEHVAPVLAGCAEIMVHAADDPAVVAKLLATASDVAIGPGLGQDDWSRNMWQMAIDSGKPLVVDADALRLLAAGPQRRDDWVLTPHPGEAAALLGSDTQTINADRVASADELQRRFGGSVVLKGAGTVIASEGSVSPGICSDGNPGMASAGMGDVLTGVIGALLAQGLSPRDAAEVGVCLHAAAGDVAAVQGERGLLASDLIDQLRSVGNRR